MFEIKNILIDIDKIINNAIEYLVEWYTGSKTTFSELSEAKAVKIKAIARDKKSLDSIGEFIACSYLINEGYKILNANISFATYGRASERGVDAILEKYDIPYICEIKTNTSTTYQSYSSIKSSLIRQLDDRVKNLRSHFEYVADIIEQKHPNWIKNFEKKWEWFNKNYKTKGIIVTDKKIKSSTKKHELINIFIPKIKRELNRVSSSISEEDRYE